MANISKRGKSYQIRVSLGYDIRGKKITKTMSWTPEPGMTDRQIQKELNRIAYEFEQKWIGNTIVTAVKFETLAEEWFNTYAASQMKTSTLDRTRQLKGRTYKAIGHLRMDKIYPRTIQSFINELSRTPVQNTVKGVCKCDLNELMEQAGTYQAQLARRAGLSPHTVSLAQKHEPVTWASAEKLSAALDRKPGELFEKLEDRKLLSPKTIRHYLSFISDVFNYAIRMRMVKENPCKEVFLPTEQEAEREVFTLEEARRFLELLEGAPMKYRVFFTLAIYGGFRRGELMGLEWKDIDLETGVVSVVRTSQYSKTRGYYTDTPKTKRSVRSLKLPMNVMELLKRYRIEQGFEGRKMGDRWKGTDRLFTALDGTPMNGATPYVWLRKFCRANGLPPVNIHSFRHLNASLLINSGINVRTVSACLGHSQTSTTLNIYAHTFDEANARAMEAVADVLNGTGVSEAEKKQA